MYSGIDQEFEGRTVVRLGLIRWIPLILAAIYPYLKLVYTLSSALFALLAPHFIRYQYYFSFHNVMFGVRVRRKPVR
ncbi:hypothetical protein C8Q74DRAFT_1232271 [Fomes fomentarius]|nr:hypothetical protein C8Q74DRAFT_1232271 [Fomes fomentarius]